MWRVDPVISATHPQTWVVTAIHMAQQSELIRKLPGMEGLARHGSAARARKHLWLLLSGQQACFLYS